MKRKIWLLISVFATSICLGSAVDIACAEQFNKKSDVLKHLKNNPTHVPRMLNKTKQVKSIATKLEQMDCTLKIKHKKTKCLEKKIELCTTLIETMSDPYVNKFYESMLSFYYHKRGKAYHELGYSQKAIDDFTTAIKLHTSDNLEIKLSSHYGRLHAYAELINSEDLYKEMPEKMPKKLPEDIARKILEDCDYIISNDKDSSRLFMAYYLRFAISKIMGNVSADIDSDKDKAHSIYNDMVNNMSEELGAPLNSFLGFFPKLMDMMDDVIEQYAEEEPSDEDEL